VLANNLIPTRIDFALKKMQEWYVGDGWYSDGVVFSKDYYNSFVIQPMLVDVYAVLLRFKRVGEADYQLAVKRMVRHAEFQERPYCNRWQLYTFWKIYYLQNRRLSITCTNSFNATVS
jgi:hypothetical protein